MATPFESSASSSIWIPASRAVAFFSIRIWATSNSSGARPPPRDAADDVVARASAAPSATIATSSASILLAPSTPLAVTPGAVTPGSVHSACPEVDEKAMSVTGYRRPERRGELRRTCGPGSREVRLGVDTENVHGAVAVYEDGG